MASVKGSTRLSKVKIRLLVVVRVDVNGILYPPEQIYGLEPLSCVEDHSGYVPLVNVLR